MNTPLPYAEMLRVQLRKRQRSAPVMNLVFEPKSDEFHEGDVVAVVTADDSKVYRFRADCVELPNGSRIPYADVTDCHWIAKTMDGSLKAAMKREHFGTLILEINTGESHLMTHLNQAVFPILKFFRWYLRI